MKILKAICLVLTVIYLAAVGIGPLPQSTIHDPVAFRLVCFTSALAFAGLYYGIAKRLPAVWKLGWIAVIGIPIIVIFGALSSTTSLPSPDNWIASLLIVFSGAAILSVWAIWWKRQRAYFNPSPSQ